MEYRTQIPAPVARLGVRALEELGANTSLDSFNEAIRWPCETVETSELFITPVDDYEIDVTPEIVSAVIEVPRPGGAAHSGTSCEQPGKGCRLLETQRRQP
jgi:hypothetical protein